MTPPPPGPLRVLMLEDVLADAELAERELRKVGLELRFQRVDSQDAFVHALQEFHPDIVLSDHNLPKFSGRDAVRLTQQLAPGTPVILVTGSTSEETAVDYVKAGAADYVHKDRPARLAPAVLGALARRREREERQRAEAAHQETEERLTVVVQATNDAVWDWNPTTQEIWVNERFWTEFGYRPEAVRPEPSWWFERVHPEDRGRVEAGFEAFLAGDQHAWSDQYRFRRADGSYAHIINRGRVLRDVAGRPLRMIGAIMDVTRLVSA